MRHARRAGPFASLFPTACIGALVAAPAAAAPDAVDLAVTTTDGRAIRLFDDRGRWLLVNYRATWCSDCVAEMPALSRLAERESGVAVLGLIDEALPDASLRAFRVAHPVSYAVASVERTALPAALTPFAFGIAVRPIGYLIAPDGTVVDRIVGHVGFAALEQRVRARSR